MNKISLKKFKCHVLSLFEMELPSMYKTYVKNQLKLFSDVTSFNKHLNIL